MPRLLHDLGRVAAMLEQDLDHLVGGRVLADPGLDGLLGAKLNQVRMPRDRSGEVLQLRFGLIDGYERTLEEIGKRFGLTRERIRQIEAKAFHKLRHPSCSKKLRDYMELTEGH